LGAEAFADASKVASELKVALSGSLDAGAASGFINKLREQVNMGKDIDKGVQVANTFNDIIKELPSEEVSKFADSFYSIDWSSAT
jgi:hypothetical protein